MDNLLAVSTTFPTLLFSIALGIVLVYWLIGMIGIVDLDLSPDIDFDLDIESDIGGLAGFLLTFGLTGIPFTLVISIIVVICWLISFYCQFYLLSLLPEGLIYYALGAVSSVIIFFVSLPITVLIIRPLRGMFDSVETVKSNELVGTTATIATARVDQEFGQARIINAGAELLVDVRCDAQHQFTIGDKALVIDYNPESHSYIVAPYPLQ
ncbi:MAG: DUF1449 family protein [Gammaproteobacteria bacterium]|nr:DUF1449 family protein [Gammaproteobacteria bacterium]